MKASRIWCPAMKEARYYTADGNIMRCRLCPHNCTVKRGAAGICGVRKNLDGRLYSTIYGELTAVAMDPIEKKPLYHFYPGSSILSIGTRGCNFKCPYCQNWHISQNPEATVTRYEPEEIVKAASAEGSIGIAYTYSEPLIWYEYVYDCAVLARAKKLKNVLVTNGFINTEPLDELLPCIDAMNIDLKSFRKETYRKVHKGGLDAVLTTIERSAKLCHVEITTLVVTGINDNMEEMKDIIDWVAALDKNIPWHISRYFPNYRYTAPATDIDFIYRTCDEAVKKLNHVYCGNISGPGRGNDTFCPSCRNAVIKRSGYHTKVTGIKDGKCTGCGYDLKIPV